MVTGFVVCRVFKIGALISKPRVEGTEDGGESGHSSGSRRFVCCQDCCPWRSSSQSECFQSLEEVEAMISKTAIDRPKMIDTIRSSVNHQPTYGTSTLNEASSHGFTLHSKGGKTQSSSLIFHSTETSTSKVDKKSRYYKECLSTNKGGMRRYSSVIYLQLNKKLRTQVEHHGLSRQSLLLLDSAYHAQAMSQLDLVDRWNFNIFSLENNTNGHSLFYIVLSLFERYAWMSKLQIEAINLFRFLKLVEEGYHSSNAYHNSIHAADVVQAMHCNIQTRQILEHLSAEEAMACILAAACHDLDHPGLNQSFLIKTNSPLALLYDNTSVLENHHYKVTKYLINDTHLFSTFTPQQKNTIDSVLYNTIIATDIFQHKRLLDEFELRIKENNLDLSFSDEDRIFVLQMALKCADISNPCRAWPVCYRWSELICAEFFRQGDCERKLKLPVNPNFDRKKQTIASVQIGFTSFIVEPLFRLWHTYVDTLDSGSMLAHMSLNQRYWNDIKKGRKLLSFKDLYLSNNNNSPSFLGNSKAGGESIGGCDTGGGGGHDDDADVWQLLASKRRHSMPLNDQFLSSCKHPSNSPYHTSLKLVPECNAEVSGSEQRVASAGQASVQTSNSSSEYLSNESNAHFLEVYKASCRRSSFPLNVTLSPESSRRSVDASRSERHASHGSGADKKKIGERQQCLATFIVSGFISSLYISTIITDQRFGYHASLPSFKGVLGFGGHDRMRNLLCRFLLGQGKVVDVKKDHPKHLLLLTNQLVTAHLLS